MERKIRKLLIFVAFFYPHIGGQERYVYEISRRLAEKGYIVDILTTNTERTFNYERVNDTNIYRLNCWNLLNGSYPIPKPTLLNLKIFQILLSNNYSIINTHTRFFITSLLGLIFSKIKKIPIIHIEHGSIHNTSKLFITSVYDHTFGSMLVKSTNFNIGISGAACKFLKHLGAKNIHLIPNGTDTNFYRKINTIFRQKLGIGERDLILSFVGRLIEYKGVQNIISVLPQIKSAFPKIKFLIVGDGPYRSELEKMVNHKGLNDFVSFLGERKPNEVVEILSITDIFTNPSYMEGLPTTVLEAASVGLPIIASDVGGTKEIVIDGKTGLLYNCKDTKQLEDKLILLLSDSKYRKELGENARRFAIQKYDWSIIIDQLIDVIEKVCENEPKK